MISSLRVFSFAAFVAFVFSEMVCGQTARHPEERPEWKAFYAKQAALRHRGTEVLRAEDALEGVNACKGAGDKAALDACARREFESTQRNYVDYVRAIGALLRLSTPANEAPPPVPATPTNGAQPDAGRSFDVAEALWAKYRQSQCTALGDYYWGGDIVGGAVLDCRTQLTRRHIHDLADLYADLWH